MKIAVLNPYWHILGGGERYLVTIASCLSNHHEVYVFADEVLKEKSKSVFAVSLDRVHFLPLKSAKATKFPNINPGGVRFDTIFYLTDGSVFFPAARNNFLIIQSPSHIPSYSIVNRFKLKKWHLLCYSRFMQEIISKKIKTKARMLSPCVDTDVFTTKQTKENIIISVGRFFSHLHSKKQEILIDAFKKNYPKLFSGWKLVLVGGLTDTAGKVKFEKLKEDCKGFPIEVRANPPFDVLVNLYKKSKIYWHAAGFGEDAKIHPERMEHFGITTLEAMAAGLTPVVYQGGGQEDIVQNGINGLFWRQEDELVQKTVNLIQDSKELTVLAKNATLRAGDFSCHSFYEKINSLV